MTECLAHFGVIFGLSTGIFCDNKASFGIDPRGPWESQIFFYHAMAAKSQLRDKSLWVRACYNYYLRLSSASFKAFDRLALLGDWQAFHQPPWASLSTTGGGEGELN